MTSAIKNLRRRITRLPPELLYQRGLLLSVMLLSGMVLLLSAHYANKLERDLERAVSAALERRPWVASHVVIKGRDVHLVGEVESRSGLKREMDLLAAMPGVARVVNHLQITPKPAPHIQLRRDARRINLRGKLSGEHLDELLAQLAAVFPDAEFDDDVEIDDAVGRPLWLDGFDAALRNLTALRAFELNAWRDQIMLSGAADDAAQLRDINQTFSLALIDEVNIENRLHVGDGLLITIDASGAVVAGNLGAAQLSRLQRALAHAFGETARVRRGATVGEAELHRAINLLPALAQLAEARLQTTPRRIYLWGRAAKPQQLGALIERIHAFNLDARVDNQVALGEVARPTLALFFDRARVSLVGRLPNAKVHARMMAALQKNYAAADINDRTELNAHLAVDEWTRRLPEVLALAPQGAAGVSIDAHSVLVTGNVKTRAESEQLDEKLRALFPRRRHLNWVNIAFE